MLERARRRRADGDHAAPLGACAVDGLRGGGGDLVSLGIDLMLLNCLRAHWLERAVADVKRDLGTLNATAGERVQQLLREVQSGRRRGDRPFHRRVNGLIALAVHGSIRAFDVRRQRNVTERVDQRVDARASRLGPESDQASPEKLPLDDLGDERSGVSFEPHASTFAQLLTGVHESVPQLSIVALLFSSCEQKTFDHPAGIHSAPEKPRRKYSGVVGHEQVAGAQEIGQIAEAAVLGPAVETIQHHQP